MTDVVIEARQLTRRFGDRTAVDRVDFQVKRGAIFGLLGPNGSGKSTIIRMLLGILPASAGGASVLGHDSQTESERIKTRVGYMSQQFGLYADLSVRENIDFYARIYGLDGAKRQKRRESVLELTSLTGYVDQLAGTLSGGWKRRLALACALVHEPDVLFLDEPTAGIDPVARRHLWDLLFELSGQGVTLFVTTHYMDEAERCTDVAYVFLSKLLVLGKPDQLKSLPQITPEDAQRYELRIQSPAKHLAALRAIEGVRDATLFGETVHALMDRSLDPRRALSQLGLPTEESEIREIPPSLEDVFVTLTADAEEELERDGKMTKAAPTIAPAEDAVSDPIRPASDDVDSPNEASPLPQGVRSDGLSPDRSGTQGLKSNGLSPDRSGTQGLKSNGLSPDRSWTQGLRSNGLWAVFVKELVHIRRQPTTLFFMLVVPVMQTIIFGYAIDTQVEHIPTVVFNMDGRRYSRDLETAFVNTQRFNIVEHVHDTSTFHQALRSGRAQVGLLVPPNYSDRMLRGERVEVQVLIDGSDSQVASTAQSTAQLLGLNLSIQLARAKGDTLQLAPARDPSGEGVLPIETRTRLLYNPALKSSHFFVPGLVGIILQLVTLFLTSFAIVRERELGTLEQLFVTPVGRMGLLFGKLLPYAMIGGVETMIVLTVMIYVFGVPIHGSVSLLLMLSMLFMVCSLGLGLLVSTIAKTQLEAMQFAFIIMLPSVLLSGFAFPRSEMPLPIYGITFAIPATYFIEILRGIILRAAHLSDILFPVLGLIACGAIVLGLSLARFRKQLA